MADVVVVGAGLAGLACALHLGRAGVDVELHEAEPVPGGRVRTDRVDDMLLDRGFQVHNTAYPEARRLLDHDRLDLRAFTPGALVRVGDRLHRVGDPRRVPSWAPSTLAAPIGSLKDKALVGALAARDALTPPARLLDAPETTTREALARRGFSDEVVERFFRPFLAGVYLEDDLATSSRFFDLLWRSFARGTQCVPAAGMGAIPGQLAARLRPGVLRTDSPVESLPRARAVVVATQASAAARLVPDLVVPAGNSVTTHYHLAPEPPTREPAIALDGERSGPVSSSVVLTNAAPSYAPGRHLVSSSVVRGPADEPTVRAHLARLWGVDTASWEHVAAYEVREALPDQRPPMGCFRRPVRLRPGLYVCGDHRDSASIQGALVSGRRAATAVLEELCA
ncbi:MAG: FAD-dependent oxidoreductase [Actinomycetota bacterium]|nr:FAD-dependent oxidoreductase [Actinomycetota bacterium]